MASIFSIGKVIEKIDFLMGFCRLEVLNSDETETTSAFVSKDKNGVHSINMKIFFFSPEKEQIGWHMLF